ncbi:c-type cytochrome [Brucella sp. BE17]|uniref:c-type cytochrome n=1 Tax=Brucella sp. BE17 TaxID=3142977 RepID=UPI0031B9E1E1
MKIPQTRHVALAFFMLSSAGEAIAQDVDAAFRRRCASCHALEEGVNRTGPSLANIFGRTAGTLEGARYSSAMRDADFIWDKASLDAFLEAPRSVVPGTSMAASVRNAEERSSIIEFLSDRP